ncbi:MAG: hypothetical protein CM1200mP21_10550 [Candidatus Poseidoniales archaeon]|nr:MAG: hypothetical protein CM1200mP21_10550 [Candidatus Poseidoniales archaeon]
MLDISMFREHSEVIRADHDRRGLSHEAIDEVIRLDEEWRKARYEVDQLRKARNDAARGIAGAKKAGDSEAVDKILAEVADIGSRIDELSELSDDYLAKRDVLRMSIPNILHDAVPIGEDDQKNTLHSMHGEKIELGFEPQEPQRSD